MPAPPLARWVCPEDGCGLGFLSEVRLAEHLIARHGLRGVEAAEMAREVTPTSGRLRPMRQPRLPTVASTNGHHVCHWCKRPQGEPHTMACKNPRAATEGRGPNKKDSAPHRLPTKRRPDDPGIAIQTVPTPELVAALERGVRELGRRLALLDQVKGLVGS